MKTPKTSLALAALLLAPLVLGTGCAKKQLVSQGQDQPGATAGAQAPAGKDADAAATSPKAPAATPEASKAEAGKATPPKGSGALEPAPARAATPTGIASATTLGLQRIHFGFDQAVLTPAATQILAADAKYLKENSAAKIRIEGHCDERGTVAYNLALGEKRAKATYQHLTDLGIDPARMTFVSYGKEQPLDPAHGEDAWAKNRRAELVQLGK
ncbi:MAG: OmpA family protein [Deltaproteobacteria bacterium]|nr:OmpA family protein [Deltaproteobacteria bacterium]